MVRMRDGVRLATDVYLPAHPGRMPAVLVRLPYDKCGRYTFMPQMAPHFTERGYAFVVQDVRGKFRSEGETMPFVHEIEDGYDTLTWIATQPWCNGDVGMWGDSYYGYTQWAAVASGHSALKAIVPRVTSTDFQVLNWWRDEIVPLYSAGYLAECWLDRNMYHFEVDWSARPLAHVFDEAFAAVGRRSAFCDLMIGVDRPKSLASLATKPSFERLRVPVLHSVGWFDNVAPYSFDDYEALVSSGDKRGLQYLVADATDHEMYHLRHTPVTTENDHAASDSALQSLIPRLVGPGLEFFDVFLKRRGDTDTVPRARWFLGNAGWRTSAAWPPPESRELRLYLGSPALTATDAAGGTLLSSPGKTATEVHWTHDPGDLVPSTTLDPFSMLRDWADESPTQRRADVLTFSSQPVVEPLDLAGPVEARLSLGSTCSSMHVFVKLCDVFPDGTARMLVRGELLVREKDYGRPVTIRLSHTAHRLLPGHHLRLSVASSDHPLYLWHPGTEEDPWLATKGVANRQTLTTGGATPSHIRLRTV
jgi:uncharacterized protein